jgi:uncharacterized protein YegP (UPF0339 family)
MKAARDYAELYRSKQDGKWYWHMRAGNGEMIADSEGYSRKIDARDVLEQHFPDAMIVELDEDENDG